MINVVNLKAGEFIVSSIDIHNMRVVKGDHLQVIKTGISRWDNLPYADVKTKDGYIIEIMKNYRDFEHTK